VIKKKMRGVAEALLETAEGMHRIGVMDDAVYRRIVARHRGEDVAEEVLSSAIHAPRKDTQKPSSRSKQ
jgi:alanine racemase